MNHFPKSSGDSSGPTKDREQGPPSESHMSRAEERVKDIADLMRGAVNAVDQAVWIVDLAGTVRIANQAGADLVGCSRGELVGQSLRSLLVPEADAQAVASFVEVATMIRPVRQSPVKFRRKDSTVVDGFLRFEALSEKEGIVCLIVTPELTSVLDEDAREGEYSELSRIAGIPSETDLEPEDRLERVTRPERRETMLESIAENVPILLMYTDAAQRLRLANCESRRWFGMDPVWGVHLRKFLGVETYALISKEIDEALTLSEVRRRELQVAVAHGETRWLSLRILPEIGRYEGVEGLFFVGLDITTQRRKVKAERELTERTAAINEIARRVAPDASSSEILSGAADTLSRIIPSGIASWGSVGETGRLKIAYSASEPKEETQPGRDLDVDLTQVPDCLTMLRQGTTLTIQDVAQEPGFTDLRASFQAAQVRALMGKSVQSGEGHLDLLLVHSDQATRWSYHHVKMLEEVSQYLASALEKVYAFEAVRTEEQIRAEQALRDPLTGLPNRRIFDELLAQVLAQSRRNQKLFALLYLDLDDFKLVNDRFGHAAGDEFLKTISERLKGLVRETDTVARLGGDEFSILLSEISRPQHSGMLAEKVLSGLTKPVSLDEGIVDVSASIGISIYPFDGEDESELLKKADKAMYEAKKQGKNAYCHYSPSISLAEKRRGERKRSLIRAFDRDEFVLHYQPMLDLEARRILGVEAFLRWQLPGEDMLFPEQFISSVEDLGLSERMLEWVLEAACVQARAWKSENILSFPISLNMGRRDLSREDLPTIVQTALAEAGLESKSLMLEFTELALMENEESRKNLEQLADLGVRLLVDDFGTGYFSLRHLSRLPIHALKLSQELVALLPGDDRIAVTANAVLALGRNMGVRVIAEAVESKEQLLFLSKNGCSSCQGKLFGGPVSPGLIPEVIGRYQLSSEG